ncbi:MAG: hypothetical protein C0458_18660 [Methylobacterium sp.]|nr:hypothetical protein [Methylobacterium sp.]
MTDDDLSKRRRKADEDLKVILAGRPTTIGSRADVVRIFHSHIVAMRQVKTSWEAIAVKLEDWSGLGVAPTTVKQYMTDISQGRMTIEPRSTVHPQAETSSAPPAKTSHSIQDSRKERSGDSSSLTDEAGFRLSETNSQISAGAHAPGHRNADGSSSASSTATRGRYTLKSQPE